MCCLLCRRSVVTILSMEWFLNLFVTHDTYIVSFIVVAIAIIIVLLLVYTQKSPEAVVKTELAGSDNIEGALRRVLGEKNWVGASGSDAESGVRVGELEKEVLEKDKTIADLNKQLTQSGGAGGGDDTELMARINELEARLQEYEIIEDDIADLSLYKTENEKLKTELERLKALAGQGVAAEEPEPENVVVEAEPPAPEPEPQVAEEPEAEVPPVSVGRPAGAKVDAADLVAEFEKVVNNQDMVSSDEQNGVVVTDDTEVKTGSVVTMQPKEGAPQSSGDEPIHPKLKDVAKDSKEEAEVFIADLKSLKKLKEES